MTITLPTTPNIPTKNLTNVIRGECLRNLTTLPTTTLNTIANTINSTYHTNYSGEQILTRIVNSISVFKDGNNTKVKFLNPEIDGWAKLIRYGNLSIKPNKTLETMLRNVVNRL